MTDSGWIKISRIGTSFVVLRLADITSVVVSGRMATITMKSGNEFGMLIDVDKTQFDELMAYIGTKNSISDSDLFRFWIDAASRTPGKVARALAECTTPESYRSALRQLMQETE